MPALGTVVTVYVLACLVELYLFLMQRATLEISRLNDLDPIIGRHMLPLWYNVVWPTKLVRFGCLFVIWRQAGWLPLGVAIALPMIATTVWPVPYRHFIPLFRKKINADMGTEFGQYAPKLTLALMRLPQELVGKSDGTRSE